MHRHSLLCEQQAAQPGREPDRRAAGGEDCKGRGADCARGDGRRGRVHGEGVAGANGRRQQQQQQQQQQDEDDEDEDLQLALALSRQANV